MRRIAIAAVVGAMAFLVYCCGRMAWADHLSRASDADTVARAVRLAPGNADYRLNLATLQAAANVDPGAALESATALDPRNADAWIRLGLQAEVRRDFPAAERDLLQAASVSRQYAPRWTLASYYFRRGERAHFWQWAGDALRVGYGDLNPVFQLCWNMSQDDREIRERAIPARPSVLNSYTWFLLQRGRLAASEPVARKLADLGATGDVWTLLAWCDAQLDKGSVAAAVAVWNRLCARRLLPYAPLDADRAPVTNPDFSAASPVSGGFAWRLPAVPGVAATEYRRAHYLRVEFSGDQPETCAPVWEFVPLTPGAGYRLRFAYRTWDIAPASGLRWSVLDHRTGAELAASSPWLSSAELKREEFEFRAPASGIVRLTLSAQRVTGATRISGSVELRELSMERVR